MADKLIIDWKEYNQIVEKLAIQIHASGFKPNILIGIMRGGAPIIDVLSRVFKLKCAYLAVESYSGEGIEDQHRMKVKNLQEQLLLSFRPIMKLITFISQKNIKMHILFLRATQNVNIKRLKALNIGLVHRQCCARDTTLQLNNKV